MSTTIAELAVLLSVAAAVGMVARMLRQPMILAYLVVGAVATAAGFFPVASNPLYQTFSDLGVMFLLFLVGLEINISALRRVGLASAILGLGQVVFTFVLGYFIGLFLGLPPLSAAYIAIALTFSSTVIVVKLLSERQDMNSLYGKLSLGVLLVQDIAAVLILVVLSGLRPGQSVAVPPIVATVGQAVILFSFAYWLGRTIIPRIFIRLARSEELLFLTSLAWVMLLATAVRALGFSIEIGGFLAGISLANSSTHFQIASRVRPLRDFFIALFFIVLGSTIVLTRLDGLTVPIIVFSLFVLIGNPLIVILIMGMMGYHRRTSFLTGVTIAQISEFSLILAAIGLKLGHIQSSDVTIITAVGIITITASSYMIIYAEPLYRLLRPVVTFFHRGHIPPETSGRSPFDKPVVVIGAHRIGRNIVAHLQKDEVLIIDSDPDVIAELKHQRFTTVFGDSSDDELLDQLEFDNVRLVISTMPNLDDNLRLLAFIQSRSGPRHRRFILRAESSDDAERLYQAGTDYVLQPELTSGQFLGHLVASRGGLAKLTELSKRDRHLSRQTAGE